MFDINEIKKDLYKSKNMAKFSHYVSGNLYYTVELANGIFQFIIPAVETGTLSEINDVEMLVNDDKGDLKDFDKKIYDKKSFFTNDEEMVGERIEIKFTKLSSDLGSTSFEKEMRGSELIRWIQKSINSNDFIKVG